MAETVRLDKVFSNLGILSRSECKKQAKKGFITVNGEVVKETERKVNPDSDIITYMGEVLYTKKYVYYMLNKPAGYITANDDRFSETVFDLVMDKRTDLSAVGRLDKDTTGILLLTNDGDLNHRLLSPKNHVEKTYDVLIDGALTENDVRKLEKGIDIGDEKPTLPAKVEILSETNPQNVRLIITEGRFHQVKRMFDALDKPVLSLHRSMFGPLKLDPELEEGTYRELTCSEMKSIMQAAKREDY